MFQIQILSNKEITEGIFLLSFRRIFDFEPGQIIEITSDKSIKPRMYSICSSNKANNIDILYGVKKEGQLTPCLSKLLKGDTIHVSEPKGNFKSNFDKSVWIAAGTGIAPFASMFLSGDYMNKMLIHGAIFQKAFLYAEEFRIKLCSNYIQCCSRETFDNAFYGRVTDYLLQMPQLSTESHFFICGSAEMVIDSREILLNRGVNFNNITAEIYF